MLSNNSKKSWIAYPYILWAVIFTIIPLLIVVYYAFTKELDGGKIVFTWDNLIKMANPDNGYIIVFWRSIRLAVISTVICLLIGYPAAMAMASRNMSMKKVMVVLIMVPMWMNFLLRTYATMTIIGKNGFLNMVLQQLGLPTLDLMYSEGTVIFGMVYNYLPFMILPIYNVLLKTDYSLIEASHDLGANARQTFMRVTLPLSMPGVLSGISMVFMPAVSTFIISRLLGGGNSLLIGDLIEQQYLQSFDWHFGSMLAFAMMIIILITMTVIRDDSPNSEGGLSI